MGKWENGIIKIRSQNGILINQETQDQLDISSIVNEMTDFIDTYPADQVSTLTEIPANLQIGDEVNWQEYLDDPKANISSKPNGLSTIHVDLSNEIDMNDLAATVVFHEIDGLRRFDAVQIYNQSTSKPISSTVFRYGQITNDFIPILGYENRTIIQIGDNTEVELQSIALFENFELKTTF